MSPNKDIHITFNEEKKLVTRSGTCTNTNGVISPYLVSTEHF